MKQIFPFFFAICTLFFISCKSKCEKAEGAINEKINIAYTLLDNAASKPKTDLHIPMGFVLNCTFTEFR